MTDGWVLGRCVIRQSSRQVLVDGEPVRIGARAFDLLVVLAQQHGSAVSKSELLDLVWPGSVVEENNLQVHVWALRKLLGPNAIVTVPGQGYRLALTASNPATDALPAPVGTPAFQCLPRLYGRDENLRDLNGLIEVFPLICVVGAGGVGKTALVHTLAQSMVGKRTDGVYSVDLGSVTGSAQLVQAVAGALQFTMGARSDVATLAARVRGRAFLLVLDDCEHLLEPVAELAVALIKAAPQIRILATSQEALKIGSEHTYRLPPLALLESVTDGSELSVAQARACAAIALFEERARAADANFRLTPQNLEAVADVCRQLDGVALAIELAAARVPLLGLAGLRQRLHEPLRLLSGGARDVRPRHRSLRSALEWSHGLLTPVQQAVFRRLGLMEGSFSVDAAQQVAADATIDKWAVLDAVDALAEKSLLIADTGSSVEGGSRLRMLQTVRHYAFEQLSRGDELESVRARHLECYLMLAEAAREPLSGQLQGQWLSRLDLDRENLIVAHRACDLLPSSTERGLRLVNALPRYWQSRGLLDIGQQMTMQALARPGAETFGALYAEALLNAGWLDAYRGLDHEAAVLLKRSVAAGRACGAEALVAEALSRLGYTLIGLDDRSAARACIEEACQLAERHRDKPLLRRLVVSNLAELERFEGRFQVAEALYDESLIRARSAGDRLGTLIALNNLAMVDAATGNIARGRERLRESLRICDEIQSRRGRLVVVEACVVLSAQLGEWERTARLEGAAAQLATQMGRRRNAVDTAFLAPFVALASSVMGEAYSVAHACGAAMSYDQAVAELAGWLRYS